MGFWFRVVMLGVCLGAVLVAKYRLSLLVENDSSPMRGGAADAKSSEPHSGKEEDIALPQNSQGAEVALPAPSDEDQSTRGSLSKTAQGSEADGPIGAEVDSQGAHGGSSSAQEHGG